MPVLALELIPLAIASAVIPLPLIVTILLLRTGGGRLAALAWVGGQTAVRLVQGLLIALLLDRASSSEAGGAKSGPVVATALLVLGILFYVLAARKAVKAPDDDAPPPRWMELLDGATPGRAFALGCALMAISVKFWVFTLGATSAIADARLDPAPAAAAFAGFVLLALSLQLALILLAFASPVRADAVLGRVGEALERHNRSLLIAVGLIFGTVFLLEGLAGLGVL